MTRTSAQHADSISSEAHTVIEIPPPSELAEYVESFWFRPAGQNEPDEVERVLPDGCLDIVFGPRRTVVVGTMTQALVVPGGSGASYMGVRFRAGMATAFLRISAASVTDGSAPLDALWSDARTVNGYVTPLPDADIAVGRLADVLVARLSHTTPVPDDVRSAVDAILSSGGRSEVEPIASSIGVSRQHLARRFGVYVGVPPKVLARVTRMREVVRLAIGGRVNWAGIAADLGYSDQSHLVSEFKSLTGLTPSRWAASHRRSSVRPEEAPRP